MAFVPPDPLHRTADLLARIRAGDAAARAELLSTYQRPLDVFLHGRVPATSRGMTDTIDLVQEVLLQALRRLDGFSYQGIGSFWAFLRTIGLNAIRDQVRRGQVRGPAAPLPPASAFAGPTEEGAPMANAIKKEDLARFDVALESVQERERNALLMRLELDLDFKTIAEECGFPSPDAARMAVNRTLQDLIRKLADHGT